MCRSFATINTVQSNALANLIPQENRRISAEVVSVEACMFTKLEYVTKAPQSSYFIFVINMK